MCARICHDDFKPTNSDGFKEIFSNIKDVLPMAFAFLLAVSTLQQAQAVKKSSGATVSVNLFEFLLIELN